MSDAKNVIDNVRNMTFCALSNSLFRNSLYTRMNTSYTF